MTRRFSILIVAPARWSLVTPTGERTECAPDVAAVAAQLILNSSLNTPLVLGVPSSWCLSSSISTADLSRNDAKAFVYRLEENLPLAAENVVADFALAEHSALGVCVRLELIQPLLDSLLAAGITVQWIVPTCFAAAQGLIDSIDQATFLLLCHEPGDEQGRLNAIVIQNARPSQWDLIPATATDLKLLLEMLSAQWGFIPHIEAIDVDANLTEQLVESCEQVIHLRQENGWTAAAGLAGAILSGRAKPWINFRRDQLAISDSLAQHRRWIDLSLSAAVIFLIALMTAFLWRAHRYQQVDDANRTKMVDLFHDRFPTWDTPVNVRAVVDAQYRQTHLTPTPGAGHDSALKTLHDVLLPMMSQEHFQIEHMAFHENAFEISGRLASYDQIDALSKAARVDGMTVAPAQTRKDADGSWTFALQGSRPVAARGNP